MQPTAPAVWARKDPYQGTPSGVPQGSREPIHAPMRRNYLGPQRRVPALDGRGVNLLARNGIAEAMP